MESLSAAAKKFVPIILQPFLKKIVAKDVPDLLLSDRL
jgi:hypothetical protein